jgi:hypothetical protein
MLFAAVDGQWAVGGGVALMALVSLIRWLLGDNSQVSLLRDEVADLRERQAVMETEIREQRSLKHGLSGDLAKAVMALEVVRRLAQNCSCGALDSIEEIVDQLLNELSAIRLQHPE